MPSTLYSRRPKRDVRVLDLSRFSTLPMEIQLLIWKHAAEETRVLNLDISFRTAIYRQRGTGATEYVVFGGQVTPQMIADLVLPSSSQRVLKSLSLTCRDAREAVLKAYPDTIRVQAVQHHEPAPRQFLGTGHQGAWCLPIRPPHRPGRYRLLRCNFETDHFYFGRTAVAYGLTYDAVKFAHLVYRHYLSGGIAEIKNMDEFRGMLRRIKNLILPVSDTDKDMIDDDTRDLHLKTIVSAITSLENLYICPHGAHFLRGMTLLKHDLPFDAWDGELWHDDMADSTPESILYELSDVRDKYTSMNHRHLDPACYTFNAVDIAAAGDTATETAKKITAPMGPPHGEHWMRTFELLVELLGFTHKIHTTKTLEVRDRAADGQGEVVWVPRPGYIAIENDEQVLLRALEEAVL